MINLLPCPRLFSTTSTIKNVTKINLIIFTTNYSKMI
jgi:hypothetical protein